MCLIAFAWQVHPRYELAVIANRDEFHARPSAAAAFWPGPAGVFGGRDLECGGGWMLYSPQRRFAAVTNVRLPRPPQPMPRSRGALVADFVADSRSAEVYAASLSGTADEFAAFNLLLWDGGQLLYAGNQPRFSVAPVAPGLHGLSNASLDVEWPKTRHARAALGAWLESDEAGRCEPDPAPLLAALAHDVPAADAELPDTGVGIELERMLSPPFIRGEHYGTRASMVLLVDAGGAWFAESRFGPGGAALGATLERLSA